MAKDIIGQDVNVGDWAAITQNNRVYVGKVVKAGASVTIAQNRAQEWWHNNRKKWNSIDWRDRNTEYEKMFGPDAVKKFGIINYGPDYARDGKFVKIDPTEQMKLLYENGTEV